MLCHSNSVIINMATCPSPMDGEEEFAVMKLLQRGFRMARGGYGV